MKILKEKSITQRVIEILPYSIIGQLCTTWYQYRKKNYKIQKVLSIDSKVAKQ